MTEGIQKRNYDGDSEACCGCKAFYRTGDMSVPHATLAIIERRKKRGYQRRAYRSQTALTVHITTNFYHQ